ncbi:hypothetical protein [Leyella stercorea]|uniref:hypothetical protein n=1 Tax=Leyella stercorea TaxID=363265 RepID=UPI0024318F8C|nr:hypothetical protein [Leyella stercorea]
MKKILYSVFMLATMVLAACSSDDTTEPAVKRGMVLKANVEDTDTRATITDNEGKWKFAFATKDVVKVGNDEVTGYYTFTNNGTVFESTDAKQTAEAANWCAFFPGETIDLRNQSGAFADVAKNYALAGATASATTGSDGLTVTMKAKAAVLCIVGVKKDERLDINVRDSFNCYISGFVADKNTVGFSVQTSETKVSLLNADNAGVYYVVVPAGVKLSVYNGTTLIKATKAGGLTAGKYYTLLTGKTTDKEYATINGEKVEKEWVQLWPGGPKFATENVAKTLNRSEATAEGSAYVWGANWRTPTKEEMNFVNEHALTPINVKAEFKVQNGVPGILYTGIQPGYTDKTIFLSSNTAQSSEEHFQGVYWTSTEGEQSNGVSLNFLGGEGVVYMYYFDNNASTVTANLVRPVLAK